MSNAGVLARMPSNVCLNMFTLAPLLLLLVRIGGDAQMEATNCLCPVVGLLGVVSRDDMNAFYNVMFFFELIAKFTYTSIEIGCCASICDHRMRVEQVSKIDMHPTYPIFDGCLVFRRCCLLTLPAQARSRAQHGVAALAALLHLAHTVEDIVLELLLSEHLAHALGSLLWDDV